MVHPCRRTEDRIVSAGDIGPQLIKQEINPSQENSAINISVLLDAVDKLSRFLLRYKFSNDRENGKRTKQESQTMQSNCTWCHYRDWQYYVNSLC